MANNRIMEELGISVLASTLSSLPTKKATSKGGGSGSKGKRSSNCAGTIYLQYKQVFLIYSFQQLLFFYSLGPCTNSA